MEDDEEMLEMYEWIDTIPLSREKKNIARDFSDGVLMAEILKFYFPKFVEIHNYPSASSSKQKLSNWNTLNLKVFKKIKFHITQEEIDDIVVAKPNAIEKILLRMYNLIVKKDSSNSSKSKANKPTETVDTRDSLIKKINQTDQCIQDLYIKKEELEKKIQDKETENQDLQRKIEEAFAKMEARYGKNI